MTDSGKDRFPARSGKLDLPRAAPDGEGEAITGIPFSREIGMRLHQAGDGVAVVSVPYDERLIGDPETGVLHGGVVTALLDTACGWAVMAAPAKLKSTATLDLRIDYMRPATAGEAVFARAECYRLTRSIGFARAVAYTSDPSDPVATAQGAFILDRVEGKSRP
ncbi:MAG: PaaI family thioesterase [Proteobacteria bacterium]|nr:PaaI family thioesterase [Pseudomonadota bacterium]